MGRHSELEIVEFDIKCGYFSVFEGLEYVVGRVLLFLEFGGNCPQNLPKDVVKKSKGELILEINYCVVPVAKNLAHQSIFPQFFFQPADISEKLCFLLPDEIVEIKIIVCNLIYFTLILSFDHGKPLDFIADFHVFVHLKYLAFEVITFLEVVLEISKGYELHFAESYQLFIEVCIYDELLEFYYDL